MLGSILLITDGLNPFSEPFVCSTRTYNYELSWMFISLGPNSSMFVNCSVFCDVRHVQSSVLGQNVIVQKCSKFGPVVMRPD